VLFVFVGWFVLLVLLPSALVAAFEFCSGVFFFFFKQACFWGYTHSLLFAPPHFSTHTRWKIKHWVCLFFLFALVSVAAYERSSTG
jgi:hypothetical protein